MFQIYRNLHQGLKFSIRERGRVIERLTDFVAYNVRFQVGEGGRQRVLRERRKNVHAFVTCEEWLQEQINTLGPVLTYNPYLAGTFMCEGSPIYSAQKVAFTGGKCYFIS